VREDVVGWPRPARQAADDVDDRAEEARGALDDVPDEARPLVPVVVEPVEVRGARRGPVPRGGALVRGRSVRREERAAEAHRGDVVRARRGARERHGQPALELGERDKRTRLPLHRLRRGVDGRLRASGRERAVRPVRARERRHGRHDRGVLRRWRRREQLALGVVVVASAVVR
jgi:hypothetical protein